MKQTARNVDSAYVKCLHLYTKFEQKRLESGFCKDVIKCRLILNTAKQQKFKDVTSPSTSANN